MNNGKKQKKELQSEIREEFGQQDAASETGQTLKPLVSFDAYFQKLLKTKPNVMLHHKAPMRQFAESNGLDDAATEDEFDSVFSRY